MYEMSKNLPASESTTITFVGTSNMAPSNSWALPTSGLCSYTAPDDITRPSAPLSEGAVRLGNSLVSAFVPEDAIRRDVSEDI